MSYFYVGDSPPPTTHVDPDALRDRLAERLRIIDARKWPARVVGGGAGAVIGGRMIGGVIGALAGTIAGAALGEFISRRIP
jgi:uncharacterized protein YcfJ